MDDVPRRSFWLTAVGTVAAGAYVAYRNRNRSGDAPSPPHLPEHSRSPATRGVEPSETVPTESVSSAAPSSERVSTGTADMVVASMETTSAVPVPLPASALESPPSPSGSTAGPAEDAASPNAETVKVARRRPVELPRQRRPSGPTLIGLAIGAGALALALGAWAFVSSVRANDVEDVPVAPALSGLEDAVGLLAQPGAVRMTLRGSVRRIVLVVQASGDAALVLNGLGPAPEGRTYQAWVARAGATSYRSAALFSGREAVVPLALRVPVGTTVAVTLEQAGGAPAPTRVPKLFVTRTG